MSGSLDDRAREWRRQFDNLTEGYDLGFAGSFLAEETAALVAALVRDRERLQRIEEAFVEVHDYHCGCAQPGSHTVCVAEPIPTFAALAVSSGGEETRE